VRWQRLRVLFPVIVEKRHITTRVCELNLRRRAIGTQPIVGSASYAKNVFTVVGAGALVVGTTDAFHFVYQPLSGDGTIVARLVSVPGVRGMQRQE
jgi:hypothetical protein